MDVSQVLAQTVPVGGYISIWKTIPVLIVLLAWVRLLTWADKGAIAAHLLRVPINIGNIAGLILGFFLFFLVPSLFLVFGVLLLVAIIEASVYLSMRHQKVGLQDLNKQFNDWIASFTTRDKKVEARADEVLVV